MNNLQKKINVGTYLCWGGSLLGIISLLLPIVRGDEYIISALKKMNSLKLISQPDGIIFLVLFILLAIIALFHKAILSLIASSLTLVAAVGDYISASDMIAQNSRIGNISMGFGVYLLLLGAVLTFAGAISYMVEKIKNKKTKSE